MRRNRDLLWLTVSAAALMGFSFAAGYGLRAIMWAVRGDLPAMASGGGRAFAAYPRMASRAGAETIVGHGHVFTEVMQRLKDLYVEPLPPAETLAFGAVEGLLTPLGDTNTRLLAPKEWSAVSEAQSGSFRGLGAVLTIRKHRPQEKAEGDAAALPVPQITVVAPMPGSPAEKAGLLPGDRITSVDNHWIAPAHYLKRTLNMMTEELDYSLDPRMKRNLQLADEEPEEKKASAEERKKAREADAEIRDRWRRSTDIQAAMETLTGGPAGEHTLQVERAGAAKPLTIKVQFAPTSVAPVVKKKPAPGVGYLQVRQINAEAVRVIDQVLTEFRGGGVKSLILDLRRSPGGPLAQAQEIASRFLPSGPIAVLEGRDGARKPVKKTLGVKPGTRKAQFGALVVLVDGGTAGTAEVLAAALRDAGLAKLVGAQTFGDGTEQMIFPLDNGAAVSITTAKMLSRKGTDFDGKGLKPDVPVAAAAGADRALEQAMRMLRAS